MTETSPNRPSPKAADADRNGQDFGTDRPGRDAVARTEAETRLDNLRRMSDPSSRTQPDATAQEAIERATAAVGQEEPPRHGESHGSTHGSSDGGRDGK